MRRLVIATLALSFLACSGASTPGEAEILVEECAGDADVDDTTLIAWEFKDSVHEMVICGQLTFQLVGALVNSVGAIVSGENAVPDSFSVSNGVYSVAGEGVSMDLHFEAGPDTPGVGAGPIEADVFALDSYLVGGVVSQQEEVLYVSYESPGPLVGLLGLGDSPDNPVVMGPEELQVFALNLTTLKVAGIIAVDDVVNTSTVTYNLDNPATLVADLLLFAPLAMEIRDAGGGRPDLSQVITTRSWDVDYIDSPVHSLDGVIEIEVTGGPFDFLAEYVYVAGIMDPSVTITCLDAADSGI